MFPLQITQKIAQHNNSSLLAGEQSPATDNIWHLTDSRPIIRWQFVGNKEKEAGRRQLPAVGGRQPKRASLGGEKERKSALQNSPPQCHDPTSQLRDRALDLQIRSSNLPQSLHQWPKQS